MKAAFASAAREVEALLRRSGRFAWAVATTQYFTLVTAGVLGAALFLVVTSDSFEDGSGGAEELRSNEPAPTSTPSPPRPHVLFYVVEDEKQRSEIAEAVWTNRLALENGPLVVDYVFFLIAGTVEEEAQTIARLNYEEWLAQQSGVDMQVIDLRGRFD